MTDIVTIGDMKGLVEALAATAMAKLSASTKEKMIAAAKIVAIVATGVDGARKITAISQLASQSTSDVPTAQQVVAGAQLVATAMDVFVGGGSGGEAVASVAQVMNKVSTLAATAKATIEDLCEKIKAALTPAPNFDCTSLLPDEDAGLDDYLTSANRIAGFAQDGIKALQSGETVASGDELMTIAIAMMDATLQNAEASQLFAAVTTGGNLPAVATSLISTVTKFATSLGVDTTGLDAVPPAPSDLIRVVQDLRARTSSLIGLASSMGVGGRRRTESMEDMTPEQLLSLVRVAASVYSAMQPAGADGDASAEVLELLELLAKGQSILEVVREDVLPMLVAVHNSLESDASKKKVLKNVVSIGDMKGLIESLAVSAGAVLSAEPKVKLVAATKILTVVATAFGVDSTAVLIAELAAAHSASDVPSEYQIVAGAKLVATAMDSFLGSDDATKTVASVAEVMNKVKALAATAKSTLRAMCANIEVAVEASGSICATVLADDVQVEDYAEAATAFAGLIRDRMQKLRDGGTVISGDELMTVLTLMIDSGIGGTAAKQLFDAAIAGGAPIVPATLVFALKQIATSLEVDTTGLSDSGVAQPVDMIRVVLDLRTRTNSLVGLVAVAGRRLQGLDNMAPEQLISMAKVAGAVYSATRQASGDGDASEITQVLELLDKGQDVLEVVRADILPILVSVHNILEGNVVKKTDADIVTIGDMKILVENIATEARAVFFGEDNAHKAVVAGEIIGAIAGSDGSADGTEGSEFSVAGLDAGGFVAMLQQIHSTLAEDPEAAVVAVNSMPDVVNLLGSIVSRSQELLAGSEVDAAFAFLKIGTVVIDATGVFDFDGAKFMKLLETAQDVAHRVQETVVPLIITVHNELTPVEGHLAAANVVRIGDIIDLVLQTGTRINATILTGPLDARIVAAVNVMAIVADSVMGGTALREMTGIMDKVMDMVKKVMGTQAYQILDKLNGKLNGASHSETPTRRLKTQEASQEAFPLDGTGLTARLAPILDPLKDHAPLPLREAFDTLSGLALWFNTTFMADPKATFMTHAKAVAKLADATMSAVAEVKAENPQPDDEPSPPPTGVVKDVMDLIKDVTDAMAELGGQFYPFLITLREALAADTPDCPFAVDQDLLVEKPTIGQLIGVVKDIGNIVKDAVREGKPVEKTMNVARKVATTIDLVFGTCNAGKMVDVVGNVLGTVEEIGQTVYPLLEGIHGALVSTLKDEDSIANAHLTTMETTTEPDIDDVRRTCSPFGSYPPFYVERHTMSLYPYLY
jgi:hypothetical protein